MDIQCHRLQVREEDRREEETEHPSTSQAGNWKLWSEKKEKKMKNYICNKI